MYTVLFWMLQSINDAILPPRRPCIVTDWPSKIGSSIKLSIYFIFHCSSMIRSMYTSISSTVSTLSNNLSKMLDLLLKISEHIKSHLISTSSAMISSTTSSCSHYLKIFNTSGKLALISIWCESKDKNQLLFILQNNTIYNRKVKVGNLDFWSTTKGDKGEQ